MFGIDKRIATMLALGVAFAGAGLTGCKQEGPAETAGKKVDQAVEKTGDALEKAGDKVEDAVRK
ncbi:MAG: hypothetical protein ABI794_11980 [Betaproteobacteria bacterium]